MISVEMEDVLAVLQLCKPYIIGIAAALVIGIVIMIACRRMSRDKRFLIRGEAAIAMVLAAVSYTHLDVYKRQALSKAYPILSGVCASAPMVMISPPSSL